MTSYWPRPAKISITCIKPTPKNKGRLHVPPPCVHTDNAACPGLVLGGVQILAQARLHQLRRPGRADFHDAPGAGRETPLDLGAPLPARAELLHGAARSRGATTRDIYRLVDARYLGPDNRRDAVRIAVALHSGGA